MSPASVIPSGPGSFSGVIVVENPCHDSYVRYEDCTDWDFWGYGGLVPPYPGSPCTVRLGSESGWTLGLFFCVDRIWCQPYVAPFSSCFVGQGSTGCHWVFDNDAVLGSSSSAVLAHALSVELWAAPPGLQPCCPFARGRLVRGALKRGIGSSGSSAPVLFCPSFSRPATEPRRALTVPLFKCEKSWAPNTCIGGAGAWARVLSIPSQGLSLFSSFLVSIRGDSHLGVKILLHIAAFLVPLARAALFVVFLSTLNLWARTTPGRSSPLGHTAFVCCRGAPCYTLRSLLCFSPRLFTEDKLRSAVSTRCRRPLSPSHKGCRATGSQGSSFGLSRLWALCLLATPKQVWAVPADLMNLQQAHDAYRAYLPEELPGSSVGSSHGALSLRPPASASDYPTTEHFQLMVAQVQAESATEAYGDDAELPFLHAVVLSPGIADQIYKIPPKDCDLGQLLNEISCQIVDKGLPYSRLVPADDQLIPAALTIVAATMWSRDSHNVVVVLDLSSIGGPIFAESFSGHVYREDIEKVARRYCSTGVHIFSHGSFDPWAPTGPHPLPTGHVVKVTRSGSSPDWSDQSPWSFRKLWRWSAPALPRSLEPKGWLVTQDDCSWLCFPQDSDRASVSDAIATHLCREADALFYGLLNDSEFIKSYRHEGRGLEGIVAITPRSPVSSKPPWHGRFAFLDGRHIGKGLISLPLREDQVNTAYIRRCAGVKAPPGYSLVVTGHDLSAPTIQIYDGEVLTLDFAQCAGPTLPCVPICHQEGRRLADHDAERVPAASSSSTGERADGGNGASTASVPESPPQGIYALAAGCGNQACPTSARPTSEAALDTAEHTILWVLAFAPDRIPEEIQLRISPPATWDEFLLALADARDDTSKALYPHIVQLIPQPSPEFGSVLCLPDWASSRICVLIDSRTFDQRIFCHPVDPWMQWGSFLLQTGLQQAEDFVLVVRGIAQVPGRPLQFQQGDLVSVLAPDEPFPPFVDLRDQLFTGAGWYSECPLRVSPSFERFWVLHDGGSKGIVADFRVINSAFGFREYAASILSLDVYRTTLKTARPRIRDALYNGWRSGAVVLITESLPTVPVPPGRVTMPLAVVFFDLRPILQGLTWHIFIDGEIALDTLAIKYGGNAPTGFRLHISGCSSVTRRGVTFVQARDCDVLTFEFRPDPPPTPASSSTGDEESSDPNESSSSSESEPPAPGGARPSSETTADARSRSPHGRRNRGVGHNRKYQRNHLIAPGSYYVQVASPVFAYCAYRPQPRWDLHHNMRTSDSSCSCKYRWPKLHPCVPHGYPLVSLLEASDLVGGDHVEPRNRPSMLRCFRHDPWGTPIKGHYDSKLGAYGFKLLVEPTTNSWAQATAIAHLRYAAPRLGMPWRYMTPASAIVIDDDSPSEDEHAALPMPAIRVSFRILTFGFTPEKVEVSVAFPATLAEVLPLIQAADAKSMRVIFPNLFQQAPNRWLVKVFSLRAPAGLLIPSFRKGTYASTALRSMAVYMLRSLQHMLTEQDSLHWPTSPET